jgi:hypothetical protein
MVGEIPTAWKSGRWREDAISACNAMVVVEGRSLGLGGLFFLTVGKMIRCLPIYEGTSYTVGMPVRYCSYLLIPSLTSM